MTAQTDLSPSFGHNLMGLFAHTKNYLLAGFLAQAALYQKMVAAKQGEISTESFVLKQSIYAL